MKHHEYPKVIYKADGQTMTVNSKEEHDEAGKGWEETPAAFDKKSDEKAAKSPSDKTKTGKGSKLKEADLVAMTVAELKAYLSEEGKADEELKGLRKDELIALAGAL